MKKAVFLDRDGVINRLLTEKGPRETPCLAEEFELLPGVPEALSALKQAGFLLIVVTNQPNIAKGKQTPHQYVATCLRMIQLLGHEASVDAIYACHHHPDPQQVSRRAYLKDCGCRKPKPGLILRAIREWSVDVNQSWLVGDSQTDIEAGLNAGLPAPSLIKIGDRSNLTEVVASNLFEAAHFILGRSYGPEP